MSVTVKQGGLAFTPTETEEELKARAAGKSVVIIGGTKGLGRAIGEALAKRALKVTVVGRSFEPTEGSTVQFVKADLSSMAACERLVSEQKGVIQSADEVVFTVGILAKSKRATTEEGLEEDMAVSFLNRLAILRKLMALKTKARFWNIGFPGVPNEPGDMEDLNAEKKYAFMAQHMRTVIGNECMVHAYKDKISIFGLNPGLIKTGIRENVFKGAFYFLKFIVEPLIGMFNMSAETYGENVAKLMLSPVLDGKTGLIFNQKLVEIEPNKWCSAENVEKYMVKSEELIDQGLKAPTGKK